MALVPDDPESQGLLALMLLTQARRPARVVEGSIVLLADQDRSRWDRGLIEEGHAIVRRLLERNQPGPLQIQAAINAVHTSAATASETDWRQVVALYDQLMAIAPSPVVATNRAVAVSELVGAETGLLELDLHPLPGYHPWRLARGHLLAVLGRSGEAESRAAGGVGADVQPGRAVRDPPPPVRIVTLSVSRGVQAHWHCPRVRSLGSATTPAYRGESTASEGGNG